MPKNIDRGQLFPSELQINIREKFFNVKTDPHISDRLFFENAGGSLRLKKAVEAHNQVEPLPDNPGRVHATATMLQDIQNIGLADVRLILNAKSGSILTALTASQVMFQMTCAIAENIPGKNIVTTSIEHPSAFDAAKMYAQKMNMEFRVAKANAHTGGIDVEEIVSLIDKDTCLLSVIYASNISGAILDIEKIVIESRKIKPDLHIIVDAVQHAPHGIIDLEKIPVDGINFAPYKFFGNRGVGFGWVSDRVATLAHDRLLDKPADNWELGSPVPAMYAALSEVVNYVCWIGSQFLESTNRRALYVEGMSRIKLHERALYQRLLHGSPAVPGLNEMDGVTVFFDQTDLTTRDFIVAISIHGLDHTQAVKEYEKEGVIVYERIASSLYSKRMLEACNLEGALRVSPLHCHTIDDIDRFLNVTAKIARLFSVPH